jgi:ribosome-binding factor A
MSRRTEMLGSTIQKELATIIMRELSDPRLVGMPSITRVKVSPDLSIADVFVTIMGTAGQQNAALNALRHSAGMMRTKLTKMLSMRQTPYLKFHIDENLKKEIAILEALRVVAEENAELDRKRAAEAAAAADPDAPAVPGPAETEPAAADARPDEPIAAGPAGQATDHGPRTTDNRSE